MKTTPPISSLERLPLPPPGREGWPWTDNWELTARETSSCWPVISLLIPTFNQGQFIETAIRSILLQRYPALELWVIDGGSTDETVSVIKKYEPWMTGWSSQPDRGQSDAINKGLARCTGEIFNWINSDDYLCPGALFAVAEVWKKDEPDWLVGRCESVSASTGERLHDWRPSPPKRISDFFRPNRVVLAQPSTFIRTELVKKLGGVREDLHYVMDWELYLRIALASSQKASVVDLRLAVALVHPAAKTSAHPERSRPEAIQALRALEQTLEGASRRCLKKHLHSMERQDQIVEALSRQRIASLARLALRSPQVFFSRFYWGAVLRLLGFRHS